MSKKEEKSAKGDKLPQCPETAVVEHARSLIDAEDTAAADLPRESVDYRRHTVAGKKR